MFYYYDYYYLYRTGEDPGPPKRVFADTPPYDGGAAWRFKEANAATSKLIWTCEEVNAEVTSMLADARSRGDEGKVHEWQRQSSRGGGWAPLHTEESVLADVDEAWASGLLSLPYTQRYKKPVPDMHEYVINFTTMSQIDIFFPADPARTSKIRRHSILGLRVAGHSGAKSSKMGVYALDVTHSPMRLKNVYTLVGASGVHLHQTTDLTWIISPTANMIEGNYGWIESNTASPSPLGLQWKAFDGTTLNLDPLLTVTEMSAAELAAARAAAEAETQRSLAIRAVRVAGHVGKWSDKMGVYARDATHSPKRGKNVYSLVGGGVSGVHLHQATDGMWYIYGMEYMLPGKLGGWIMSTTASPSPLGLAWKYSDGSGWHLDPLLTVTECT